MTTDTSTSTFAILNLAEAKARLYAAGLGDEAPELPDGYTWHRYTDGMRGVCPPGALVSEPIYLWDGAWVLPLERADGDPVTRPTLAEAIAVVQEVTRG